MYKRLIVGFAALIVAGCSQTPLTTVGASPNNNGTALPEQWSIKAKLGLRTPNTNGSVTLEWLETDSQYTIRIQGPLGQGNATVRGGQEGVILQRPGKSPIYSSDALSLIQQEFGWTLPVDDLRFWVRGIANPLNPVEKKHYSTTGQLLSMSQSGWQLHYSRYKTIDQWQLPGRIRANQNEVYLTLIIREWHLF
ncbi:MAG: lipoprotein insertase outer membrane protein LolB [Pseudomonadota bacterium]